MNEYRFRTKSLGVDCHYVQDISPGLDLVQVQS